jgi:hypothetical protein
VDSSRLFTVEKLEQKNNGNQYNLQPNFRPGGMFFVFVVLSIALTKSAVLISVIMNKRRWFSIIEAGADAIIRSWKSALGSIVKRAAAKTLYCHQESTWSRSHN